MIGADLLAGAAVGYLIRKARRVSRRVDGHVDDALDASTDRVCALIEGALGRDPVLALLREQSQAGTATDRTIRRAEDAIAEKAEADAEFRWQLESLLNEAGNAPGGVAVSAPGGVAAGRDMNIQSWGNGVTAGMIGSVHINSQAVRVDAQLVGLWECVAGSGGASGSIGGPWDMSGSHFLRLGEDGRGRAEYANWRVAFKLGATNDRCEIKANGIRKFTFTASGGSYQDVSGPFGGNVRCTLNRRRFKQLEAAWQFMPPANCNYMVTGDVLALHSDSWHRDYRRTGPQLQAGGHKKALNVLRLSSSTSAED